MSCEKNDESETVCEQVLLHIRSKEYIEEPKIVETRYSTATNQ